MKQSCLLCAGAAALGTLTAVADLAKAGTVFVDLDAARLTDIKTEMIGKDFCISGYIVKE